MGSSVEEFTEVGSSVGELREIGVRRGKERGSWMSGFHFQGGRFDLQKRTTRRRKKTRMKAVSFCGLMASLMK